MSWVGVSPPQQVVGEWSEESEFYNKDSGDEDQSPSEHVSGLEIRPGSGHVGADPVGCGEQLGHDCYSQRLAERD